MTNDFKNETGNNKYVVCYNAEQGIYHYCILTPGTVITSGQPNIQIFDSEEEVFTTFPNLRPIEEEEEENMPCEN